MVMVITMVVTNVGLKSNGTITQGRKVRLNVVMSIIGFLKWVVGDAGIRQTDLEEYLKNCEFCAKFSRYTNKPPLKPIVYNHRVRFKRVTTSWVTTNWSLLMTQKLQEILFKTHRLTHIMPLGTDMVKFCQQFREKTDTFRDRPKEITCDLVDGIVQKVPKGIPQLPSRYVPIELPNLGERIAWLDMSDPP